MEFINFTTWLERREGNWRYEKKTTGLRGERNRRQRIEASSRKFQMQKNSAEEKMQEIK